MSAASSTTSSVLASRPADLPVDEPSCPECATSSRWAGSPADSGFLAYCPSCDQTFHVQLQPLEAAGITLP